MSKSQQANLLQHGQDIHFLDRMHKVVVMIFLLDSFRKRVIERGNVSSTFSSSGEGMAVTMTVAMAASSFWSEYTFAMRTSSSNDPMSTATAHLTHADMQQ